MAALRTGEVDKSIIVMLQINLVQREPNIVEIGQHLKKLQS